MEMKGFFSFLDAYQSGEFMNRVNTYRIRIVFIGRKEIYEATNSILKHVLEGLRVFLL